MLESKLELELEGVLDSKLELELEGEQGKVL